MHRMIAWFAKLIARWISPRGWGYAWRDQCRRTRFMRLFVQSRLPIIAMILRPSSDRVTRKHYIKPPTIEAVVMMKKLLRHVLDAGKTQNAPQLLPKGICRIRGDRGTPQDAV